MTAIVKDVVAGLADTGVISKQHAGQIKSAINTTESVTHGVKKLFGKGKRRSRPRNNKAKQRQRNSTANGGRGRGGGGRGRLDPHTGKLPSKTTHSRSNPVSAGIHAQKRARMVNRRQAHFSKRIAQHKEQEFSHSEIFDTVWTTGGTIVPQARAGNLGQISLCPFGANIAACYGMMKWLSFEVRFRTSSDMNTNGNIAIGIMRNVNTVDVSDFDDLQTFSNADKSVVFPPYDDAVIRADMNTAVKNLQVYGGSTQNVEDLTAMFGFYIIYGTDVQDDNSGDAPVQKALGTLTCGYVAKLMNPRTPLNLSSYASYTMVGATPTDDLVSACVVLGKPYSIPQMAERSNFSPVMIVQNSGLLYVTMDLQAVVTINVTGDDLVTEPTFLTGDYAVGFAEPAGNTPVVMGLSIQGDDTQQVSTWFVDASVGQTLELNFNTVTGMTAETIISGLEVCIYPSCWDYVENQVQGGGTPGCKKIAWGKPMHQVPKKLQLNKFVNNPLSMKKQITSNKGFYKTEEIEEKQPYLKGSGNVKSVPIKGKNKKKSVHQSKVASINGANGEYTMSDDHFILFLIAIISTADAAWPTKSTTIKPTYQPATAYPTLAPRPENNNLGKLAYNMFVIQGPENTPFSVVYDSSPRRLLKVHNSTTLEYDGRFGTPINFTLTLCITSVYSGYYSFKSAGAPTKVIGRACTLGDRQTSLFFWMIKDASDKFLTIIPPASASDLLGTLYISVIDNIPGFYSMLPIVGPTPMPTSMINI